MDEEIRPPEGYRDLGHGDAPGMSNLFGVIDAGLSKLLKTEKVYCHHAAWEFNGDVWWDGVIFHESVYVLHRFAGHYTAETLADLMATVNDHHGWS